ncbi:helix-turn-helix domain-containing protein [Candidatus Woesebacteria bacterium]|nr:helix-turn-helix domain-containing protein [Candidatus Woesebacteria bacterium]
MLIRLIKHENISLDDIARILEQDENTFSLYSISKYIQRLRKKLFASGVYQNVIQTIRGYGYGLKK